MMDDEEATTKYAKGAKVGRELQNHYQVINYLKATGKQFGLLIDFSRLSRIS